MILARILEPRSKLTTARSLRSETLIHTLGEDIADGTLGAQPKKLRERFFLSRVVLVCDRGLLPDARIREEPGPRCWSGSRRCGLRRSASRWTAATCSSPSSTNRIWPRAPRPNSIPARAADAARRPRHADAQPHSARGGGGRGHRYPHQPAATGGRSLPTSRRPSMSRTQWRTPLNHAYVEALQSLGCFWAAEARFSGPLGCTLGGVRPRFLRGWLRCPAEAGIR